MPNIALPIDSDQKLGGGFSFRRNFIKGLQEFSDWVFTESIEKADICLVPSTSMVTKETINKIKAFGKKLVVRIDNVPRNSRNRNTGTSRLKGFAQAADEVIWQSLWARDYLGEFIGREGRVIYNGVDMGIFKPNGEKYRFGGKPTYLYSRYNRDETKQWERAWFIYQSIQKYNPSAKLIIVGRFSPEVVECGFDFFKKENFEYLGIVNDPIEMAKIYRGCDHLLATYYNDCYSNTYLEALACSVTLEHIDMSGGTPELIKNGPRSLYDMVRDYLRVLNESLN